MSARTSRILLNRRTLLRAGAMAGILATGRAPAIRTKLAEENSYSPTSTRFPESAAVSPSTGWRKKSPRSRKARSTCQVLGKTLIPQELEIMNAVKSGSVAMGSPAGAAATVFPEMGALAGALSGEGLMPPRTPCSTDGSATRSASRSRTTKGQGSLLFRLRLPAIFGLRRSRSSNRKTCAE